MIRSAMMILSGNAVSALLLLVRNLLIARLISVEDYGIAATFSLALAIIEMTSTFGLTQQMVQDKRGNDPDFQAALQGFQVLRGLLNAVILFLLAGPFTTFLGVPEVKWAHQMIVVVLILNGLAHFDIYRLGRHMRYGPMAVATALSPLLALIAIWPLQTLFTDYRVMLWSLIIQAAATALISHLVAERPYRIRFDRKVMAQSMQFGWPLLIDGILLFAIFNGDKLIIGREFGMQVLAPFTMAVTLTLTPALVLQKSVASFFLPQLSAIEPDRFQWLSAVTQQIHNLSGAFLVCAVALFGNTFVHLVLGPKYQDVVVLLNLLAVMQALKLMKGAAATISVARARTTNGMLSNILRVAMLPIAWYYAIAGGTAIGVIWIGILGEALGFVASLVLLRRHLGVSLEPVLPGLLVTFTIFGVVSAGSFGVLGGLPPYLIVGLLGAMPMVMPELGQYLITRVVRPSGHEA